MISALNNGKIGINVFDKAISSESNNVSNVTTVGHKSDVMRFEDLLYKNGYGKGVNVQFIEKNFNQGRIDETDIKLDAAIQGSGFFIVSERDNDENFYTRAGNFQQGEDGFLETQTGYTVLGLSPQKYDIISTEEGKTRFTNNYSNFVASLNINNNDIVYNYNVKTTDYKISAQDDDISKSGNNYKTAFSKISDVEILMNDFQNKLKLLQSNFETNSKPSTNQISKIEFSSLISQLNDNRDFLRVVIDNIEYKQKFDTDTQTTLKKLSDKISDIQGFSSKVENNSLIIENLVPANQFKIIESNVNNRQITSYNIQEASRGSGLAMLDSSRQALKKAVEIADAKYFEITSILSYDDKTIIGKEAINLRLNALGLVENIKGDIYISDDGLVFVKDEENSFLVSKISTANFRNVHGLEPVGDNLYRKTKEAGNEVNADALNKILPRAVESGNATFSTALTKLLIYQRAFEANSKSITVSDEFLKTAIDMKK